MPFGYLLRRFRSRKNLTLRQLGELTSLDYAYLHHLETRAKKPPKNRQLQKLVRALELDDRDAWLLGYVALYRDYIDIGMIRYLLDNVDITEKQFSWAVALKFREPEIDELAALFEGGLQHARLSRQLVEDFRKRG